MHNTKSRSPSRVSPEPQSLSNPDTPGKINHAYGLTHLSNLLQNSRIFRPAFDQIVADKLTMVAFVMAIYHFALAASFVLISYIAAPVQVVQLNITIGILGVVLYLLFRRSPPPPRYASLILTCMITFSVFNALYYISFTQEMRQSIFLLFVMIGASQFFLSSRWFFGNLLFMFMSWYVVVSTFAAGALFYFGFILFVGAAAAVVVFVVRRDAHQRYEWLRHLDGQRQAVLKYRTQQLEKSQSIAQQVGPILAIDPLIEQIVDLIWREFDSDYVNLFLLNSEQKILELRAAAGQGLSGDDLFTVELPIDESNLPGWVVQNGRYRYSKDVNQEPRYVQFIPDAKVQSQLDLPLRDGRHILGVLSLQCATINAFDFDDIVYMQLLASQVANNIRNAISYQREKSARHLAEALQQTGRALAGTLEWNVVIDLILKELAGIVAYDRAAVLVQRGNNLEMLSFQGFPEASQPQNIKISLENETVFKRIVELKRPYALKDAQDQIDWHSVESLTPARSWLGVPLLSSGEVIGMLSLTRETLDPYQEDEIKLAATFAGQAAIALENARLYDETTRFNQQLEYEVRQRTEAIQKAYEELEQLNRNKSDFISVVSHELRTPLTILHGYTQMLVRDDTIMSNPMRQAVVHGIETGSSRLADIVNSMLDVVKIENRELNLYPSQISVLPMIKMVLNDIYDLISKRELTLTVSDMAELPLIYADPDMLKKVFYHLIINAVKYTPDGGEITISGGKYSLNGGVLSSSIEIVVKDSGIGIDSATRELIFTKFYQTGEVSLHSSSKSQFKGGGPGLGLAIAKGIIEAHGGRIWVESLGHDEEACPGSEFHIVLPLNLPQAEPLPKEE